MTTPRGRDAPFGPYDGIRNQNVNQQQEANIVNQQKTKADDEERVDLLPCRNAPVMDVPHVWARGQEIEFQNQWNNPHSSFCELNLVRKVGSATKVFQLVEPTECGGGFTRQGFTFRIPDNFPKCDPNQCFLQYYAYSLEPRDYATCADFVINDDPPSAPLEMKDFKVYHDGEDFDKVSNDYNPYRGQAEVIPYVIQAIWELKNYGEVGNRAVELGILTQDQLNQKKTLKGPVVNIQTTLEGNLRPSLDQNRQVLQADVAGVEMGQKRGDVDSQGYYQPTDQQAYVPGIKYLNVNKLSSTLESTVLSNPMDRELQQTYIPIPDLCLKYGVDTMNAYNKSLSNKGNFDIGTMTYNIGLKCADTFGLTSINKDYYEAIEIKRAKEIAATGNNDPDNVFNLLLFSDGKKLQSGIIFWILAVQLGHQI